MRCRSKNKTKSFLPFVSFRNGIDAANAATALPSHAWLEVNLTVGFAVGDDVVPGNSVGDLDGVNVGDVVG